MLRFDICDDELTPLSLYESVFVNSL